VALSPTTSRAGAGGDTELAYAEISTSVTLTSVDEANPTSVISAGAVTFDGTTRVCIEFYCWRLQSGTAGPVIVALWDDTTTDLGRLALSGPNGSSMPCLVRRFLTPSVGAHTYRIRGITQVTGNGVVNATGGGPATGLPAYIRITTADSV